MSRLITMQPRKPQPAGLRKGRIEALGDGIFAIAMTLLIFEIKLPDLPQVTDATLLHALGAMWPQFLSYGMSFLMLGIYWIAHHNQFHVIKRTDRTLLWINILYFMCLSFIPFSATLLGRYEQQRLPFVLYGLNLIAASLVLYANWAYATRNRRLVSPDLTQETVRAGNIKILTGPAVYLVAIALAFVDTRLSFAIFLAYPMRFLLPSQADRHILEASTLS